MPGDETSDLRVLVADDSAIFRRALCSLLAAMPGVSVVGEASDADEAVVVAERTGPDVVLLDLAMPRGGGCGALRRLKDKKSRARLVLVSGLGKRELAYAARSVGADDFLCKSDIDDELPRALGRDAAVP
jgi:DNA-binding NarL/FixJ family response regulator